MSGNVRHYQAACNDSVNRLESWFRHASVKAETEQDVRHLNLLAKDIRYYQDRLSGDDLNLSDLRLVYLDLLDLYLWAVDGFSTRVTLRTPQERPLLLPLSLTEAA